VTNRPDCPFELETSGGMSASVDGARIHQLLTNLLTNAAQYRDKAYSVSLTVAGEPDQMVVHVDREGWNGLHRQGAASVVRSSFGQDEGPPPRDFANHADRVPE